MLNISDIKKINENSLLHDIYVLKYLKEKFIIVIHNNTIKTINSTAKASVVIVIVYHLKS